MTSGALLDCSKFPLIYGHALKGSGFLSALQLQPQAWTVPLLPLLVSLCSVLCPMSTKQGLLLTLQTHTCTSAGAHSPGKALMEIKLGWEGKSSCRTNLRHPPATLQGSTQLALGLLFKTTQCGFIWLLLKKSINK